MIVLLLVFKLTLFPKRRVTVSDPLSLHGDQDAVGAYIPKVPYRWADVSDTRRIHRVPTTVVLIIICNLLSTSHLDFRTSLKSYLQSALGSALRTESDGF